MNILSEKSIRIATAGIDVGSTTMSVAISDIVMEKIGNRYVASSTVLRNRIAPILTPYTSDGRIDGASVSSYVLSQFEEAELDPSMINGGTLILTGSALLRHNAREVANEVSRVAGDFVVISAGDQLEGWLAAHGSGSVGLSRTIAGSVLNVDIGGGTTKVSGCVDGEVTWTYALDIGARLIAIDAERVITRLEPIGERVCRSVGLVKSLGDTLTENQAELISAKLVSGILDSLPSRGRRPETSPFFRAGSLAKANSADFAGIVFSGGVAEYIQGTETRDFGDLGQMMAEMIRGEIAQGTLGAGVHDAVRSQAATVLGASQYTVQVSGSTVHISDIDRLPLFNVPVVSVVDIIDEHDLTENLGERFSERASVTIPDGHRGPVAFAVSLPGFATRERVINLCTALAEVLDSREWSVAVLVCNDDIGQSLGRHLEALVSNVAVVSIDGIELSTLDHIDVGRPIESATSVPVVIKSILFSPHSR